VRWSAARHFQRLLLEAAPTAIFAVDEDGVFSQVNPFGEQLLGWPPGSLLGRESMDAILDPEALQSLARSLSEAYGQRIAPDWTALRALAQHREAAARIRVAPPARAHPAGAAGAVGDARRHRRDGRAAAVATDLTALKRLERALRDSEARARDANQAKSAFLAAMSHEIRTPMIGVTGMIEVLSHTELDIEQRRSLNVIQASAEALLRIIGDILDFSKIEAGRMEIEPGADLAAGPAAQRGGQLRRFGVEQGPRPVLPGRSADRAGALRRPGAGAPGDRQLPVECDQVHRAGRGHRGGGGRAGTIPPMAPWAATRW
jgi:two-component system sensor histidine kinase EvgS